MITLTQYGEKIGKTSDAVGHAIRGTKRLKEAMEGHMSYGLNSSGCGRALYIDTEGEKILDDWYSNKNAEKFAVTLRMKNNKHVAYENKCDYLEEKWLDEVKVNESLRSEIKKLKIEIDGINRQMRILRDAVGVTY